ncbi:MAG: EamA family transporter [Flavobacteriales bacterium]|nr:MAG: EamA family transporter [Flavobacteriales bacterium]
MKIDLSNKAWQWTTLLVLAFTWGSSYMLIKYGLKSFDAYQLASTRILIAFIVLIPFAWKNLSILKGKYLIPLLFVALFGNGIPAYLFAIAQTHITSSLAGMLNTTVPLFALFIGILFGIKIKWVNALGVIIGLAGAIGLIVAGSTERISVNLQYGLFVIGATFCYGLTVNIIKKYLQDLNSTLITALAFVMIGPPTGIHVLNSDFAEHLTEPNALLHLGCIALLGVFGTAFAVILFNMLIKHTTALFAASVTYMIPVVAIFWGIIDGETVTMMHLLWITIILLGVYLVNKS